MGDMHANLTRSHDTPAPRGLRVEHSALTDWWHLPEHRRAAIRAWFERATTFGLDSWWVISIRLAGEGAIEVDGYRLDATGRRYFLPGTDELATYTVTVPVAEPPPPEWWDDTEGARD